MGYSRRRSRLVRWQPERLLHGPARARRIPRNAPLLPRPPSSGAPSLSYQIRSWDRARARCFAARQVGILASMSVPVVIDQGLTSACHPIRAGHRVAVPCMAHPDRTPKRSRFLDCLDNRLRCGQNCLGRLLILGRKLGRVVASVFCADQLGHLADYSTGFTDPSAVVVIASTAAKSSSAMVRSASVMA